MAVYHDEGEYAARVMGATMTIARSGTKQIEIELDVMYRKLAGGETEDVYGSRFPPVVYLSMTDATMGTPESPGWVTLTLRHLEFSNDWDSFQSIIGKECNVLCRHEQTQDGKTVERWSILRPKAPKAPPPASDVRQVQAMWGKLFGKQLPPTPPPAPREKPQEEPAHGQEQATAPPVPSDPEPGPDPAPTAPRPRPRRSKIHPNSIPEKVKNGKSEDIPF